MAVTNVHVVRTLEQLAVGYRQQQADSEIRWTEVFVGPARRSQVPRKQMSTIQTPSTLCRRSTKPIDPPTPTASTPYLTSTGNSKNLPFPPPRPHAPTASGGRLSLDDRLIRRHLGSSKFDRLPISMFMHPFSMPHVHKSSRSSVIGPLSTPTTLPPAVLSIPSVPAAQPAAALSRNGAGQAASLMCRDPTSAHAAGIAAQHWQQRP
ncbi:hypothetical protein B0J11DRAFT_567331 [Dendryphion nanum]|uniref:Uncharacterized protein n=1 Tax=Dendryphion nanum TaxID=256645 RepID=A0A9P9DZU5_9PLEO|nr:hypothetical protein B0J11DRAFT_567331 [Dendryphion nanum]